MILTGVIGLLIGAAVAAVVVHVTDDDPSPRVESLAGTDEILSSTPPDDQSDQVESARAFLRDWLRFREATIYVRSVFERTTDDGSVLADESSLAQDPPNRVTRRLGGVLGTVDGHPISCLTPPGEAERCFLAESVRDYDDDVRSEIETMATYFAGGAPLYRIDRVEGCYEVVLTRYVPAAPYGFSGSLCFDERTGALAETRFEFERITEHTVAVEISEEIPADAFAIADR